MQYYRRVRMSRCVRSICIAALVLALHQFAASCEARMVHGVQMGAFTQMPRAQERQRQLGLQKSSIIKEDPASLKAPFKLYMGPFTTSLEARAAKSLLSPPVAKDTFVVSWDASDAELASCGFAAYLDMPFAAEDLKSAPAITDRLVGLGGFGLVEAAPAEATAGVDSGDDADTARLDRAGLLRAGFRSSNNEQAIAALDTFLERHSGDPAANEARLRLARRHMHGKDKHKADALIDEVLRTGNAAEKTRARVIAAHKADADGNRQGSYAVFEALANDKSLAPEVRLHGMRMAAGIAHKAQEYTTAVLAFRQIERVSPSVHDRAEARVELAGLVFEQAGRGKSSWDEVIGLCDTVASDPQSPRQYVATSRLMRLEAEFYAGRTQSALAQCEQFLAEFADVRREHMSARVWQGVLLVYANRLDDAEKVLRPLMDETIAKSEKFGAHEPQSRAAYWLAYIADRKNDNAAAAQYRRYIEQQFPNSNEARKIAQSRQGQGK